MLGDNVLDFLAGYLDAQVGAVYIADGDGRFRRFAGYALPADADGDVVAPATACSARRRRRTAPLHVTRRARRLPAGRVAARPRRRRPSS